MRNINDAAVWGGGASPGSQARPVVRRLVRHLYLPLMLLGGNALGWWMVVEGGSKIAVLGLVVAAIAISFTAERVAPYRADWNEPVGDGARDVTHAVVNEVLQLGSLLSLPALVELLSIDGLWPTSLPFWLQVLGSIVIVDAGITIGHRLSHESAALWRFHAVHHSVKRMYGFNGLMKHPLHQLFETALGTAPLVLLGLPSDVALAVVVSVAIQLLLQHSNVDYAIPRPVRWLLALNQVHRFHHLKWAGIGDVNFGLFTNIWDHMMGTAAWDPDKQFNSDLLGIAKLPGYPTGYIDQLREPFRAPHQAAAV